jgi:hypothetical protein
MEGFGDRIAMMVEGPSEHIEFLHPDGTRSKGALTQTDVVLGGFHTTESRWVVWEGEGPRTETGWIHYCAHDRSARRVRAHCRLSLVVHNSRHIDAWFEHQHGDGSGSHEDSRMSFLDWEGNKWIATIQMVCEPFPASPKFELKRVPGTVV